MFDYELNAMHYLFQAFGRYQAATTIILISKVEKESQAQKSYLIFPATQVIHARVSGQAHGTWLQTLFLFTDMRERERNRERRF